MNEHYKQWFATCIACNKTITHGDFHRGGIRETTEEVMGISRPALLLVYLCKKCTEKYPYGRFIFQRGKSVWTNDPPPEQGGCF